MIHGRKWSSCWDRCGKQGPTRPHSSSFRRMCRKDSSRKRWGKSWGKQSAQVPQQWGQTAHQEKSFNSMCWADVSSTRIYRKLSSVPFRDVRSSLWKGHKGACPALLITAHRERWQPHDASQNTTSSCTDHTCEFYVNPYMIVTNNMVKMLHFWTTFCQRCWF